MLMTNKLKSIFNDSLWSISGLILMNASAQLLVYPILNRLFGSDKYGEIVYLLSIMNIVSITLGTAANYTRITLSAQKKTLNTPYLAVMAASSAVALLISAAVCLLNRGSITIVDTMFYSILCCITMWRYYGDIEYRLRLNYKGYFIYCLLIGLGYIIGIPLTYATGIWALALIPGELFGLGFVLAKGTVLRVDSPISSSNMQEILRIFLTLCGSYFISNLIFNSDRILLSYVMDNLAVSVYYISSLLGKTLSLITTPFNSVISGYLARYKGGLSVRLINIISAICVIASAATSGLCVLGSELLLPFLYPDIYPYAKNSVFICSLAQTIYFSSNIISVIVLRFSGIKHQALLNGVYAFAFISVCVPLTIFCGMNGFYIGLLATSCLRLVYGICSCYSAALKKQI